MHARGKLWMAAAIMLAACTVTVTPEPDRVATRVTEDLAVARTLTAVAPSAATPTTAAAQATPAPATTQRTPTSAPPLPTITPALTADDPVVPGFGSPNGLIGEIALPGYGGSLDTPVFQDQLVFRLRVFDPAVGTADGAGITSVDFTISDPSGTQRYASTIDRPPYCAFAGDSSCEVYVFADHQAVWPDGSAICAGDGYQAGMIAHSTNPDQDGAFWGFNFSITGDNLPPCF